MIDRNFILNYCFQAMVAHNQDQKNHISAPAPDLCPVDPPRSPGIGQAGRVTKLTSTVNYHIMSDNVLGSGQFGTVIEAIEEDTGNLGKHLQCVTRL